MYSEFIAPDSPLWNRFLSNVSHDFYHLPEYVNLSARQEGGEPCAFVVEQSDCRLMIPLLIRPIDPAIVGGPNILYDAISPYGYPCPLLYPGTSEGERTSSDSPLHAFLGRVEEAVHRVGVCATPPAHRSTGGTAYRCRFPRYAWRNCLNRSDTPP